MPHTHRASLLRKASTQRPLGLNGLFQGVFFALAFSFTAALILGVVN